MTHDLEAENAQLREALAAIFVDRKQKRICLVTGLGMDFAQWADLRDSALSPPSASEPSAPKPAHEILGDQRKGVSVPTQSDEKRARKLAHALLWETYSPEDERKIVELIAQARAEEAEACELIILRQRDCFNRTSTYWRWFDELAGAIRARHAKAQP